MRYFVLLFSFVLLLSCDKIERPLETNKVVPNKLDESLFPGNWTSYPWPSFEENTNTNRNILLEDYTGHTCVFCPAAADIAAQLELTNPNRVFVASIHASPGGLGDFQKLDPPTFIHDFTNSEGLKYGETFENGFGFTGNPRGTISRLTFNDFIFQSPANWESSINNVLNENLLKADLQAKVNYFDETSGLFLHTQIDPKSLPLSEINMVVYLIENSFTSPQKKSGEGTILDYHHHNTHRGNIDGLAFGRPISDDYKTLNGKYQVDISYKLPPTFDPTNMHLLVYLMNPITYEIYQVIKVGIK
jgi:hypothetical protein